MKILNGMHEAVCSICGLSTAILALGAEIASVLLIGYLYCTSNDLAEIAPIMSETSLKVLFLSIVTALAYDTVSHMKRSKM